MVLEGVRIKTMGESVAKYLKLFRLKKTSYTKNGKDYLH